MPKVESLVVEDEGCTNVPKIELVVVEEDGCIAVPNIELVVLEEDGCTAVPNIELVVVEDEGRTPAVEVFSGVWVSEGEGFVRNSPPVVAEDEDSTIPKESVDHINFKASRFEEIAPVPPTLPAEGALELLRLGRPLVVLKRPSADGASDVVLTEKLNPEKPVALVDVPLDVSLFAVVPRLKPVELAFEAGSLAKVVLEPNRPPFGVAFETLLLEDVGFGPNRLREGGLDVSLLADTRLEPEDTSKVDEGLGFPSKSLFEGVWVDALLIEGTGFGLD